MPLATTTEAALGLLKRAEAFFFFFLYENTLLENRMWISAINKAVLKLTPTSIPRCHNVPLKLTKCFLCKRVHLLLRMLNEKTADEKPAPRCGSNSVGMREAAKAVK